MWVCVSFFFILKSLLLEVDFALIFFKPNRTACKVNLGTSQELRLAYSGIYGQLLTYLKVKRIN